MQGFCFALLQYSPIQAFTARFVPFMQLYHKRNKTAHKALQGHFLLFAVFFRCCVEVYQAILHNLHHAGAYHTRLDGLHPIPDTTATPDVVQVNAAALL